jgi:hypothetical protein
LRGGGRYPPIGQETIMRKSRRNYYRILYVQPEAPPEVIKAAYRAIMQTLRLHPDLGGDHEQAATINEAYAVLSDSRQRAAYDQRILPVIRRARAVAVRMGKSRADGAESGVAFDGAAPAHACLFCRLPLPAKIHGESRCGRCQSPLAAPPRMALGQELGGRRAASRAAKNHTVDVQLVWRGAMHRTTLRDLSLTGISLVAPATLATHQVIRVIDTDFEALAAVVTSRPENGRYIIHARMLTMLTKRAFGVFVRTAA